MTAWLRMRPGQLLVDTACGAGGIGLTVEHVDERLAEPALCVGQVRCAHQ
ncbi:hypothetical protein [Streptomyces sp. A012304]|nr:hypothetical protein [Streptomyces sp. A012304]GKQ38455.1 hypothetical protein ALMP_49860 [Streptomyces sp. A012304]